MDENKNNVNNENTQTDNMNYSFDFANQVENEAPKDATPVQTEDTNTAATEVQVSPNVSAQTSNSENVQNVQNVDTSSSEVQSSETENVQTAEVPQASQTEVPASQDESSDTKEEDSIELIKDKKETKRFLIILFVIILLFIIALPFIFNVAG